jgi:uncharacterized protein (TIGR03905 family)
MYLEYPMRGTCSSKVFLDIENGILKKASFDRGCSGNLTGISRLIEGMPVKEIIPKLKGIPCGFKGTSCPDQLARALEMYLQEHEKQ